MTLFSNFQHEIVDMGYSDWWTTERDFFAEAEVGTVALSPEGSHDLSNWKPYEVDGYPTYAVAQRVGKRSPELIPLLIRWR